MDNRIFEEAIETAYLKLSSMDDDEFKKLLLKNKHGDYAQIVRATNFPDIEDYDKLSDIDNYFQSIIVKGQGEFTWELNIDYTGSSKVYFNAFDFQLMYAQKSYCAADNYDSVVVPSNVYSDEGYEWAQAA
jgi:hypothetical protein